MSCEKCLVKTGMLLEDKAIICKGAWIRQPFCERAERRVHVVLFPRSRSDSESKLLRPLLVFASTRTSFKQEKVRADPVRRPRAHPRVSEEFSSESILNYDVGRKKRAPSAISGLRLRDFYLWKRSFCNYRMFAGKNQTPFSDVFLSTDVETLSCL